MNRRKLQSDTLFVLLPGEPQLRPELVSIRESASSGETMHMIFDFSRVEIITSPSIGSLLLLQKQLSEKGHRLILCKVHLATKCILRVAGLDAFFEFAVDKFEALDVLRAHERALDQAVC